MPCCARGSYSGMPTLWRLSEGNTGCTAIARCTRIPRGQRPVHVGKHLVREPGDPTSVCSGENCRPYREVKGGTPMTNGRGKADRSIEPVKSPNKAEGPAAEAREGRERAKGNSPERNALRTQGRESTPSALERLRQARWFPPARVGHRYPLVRFCVFTHGGSPVTPLGRFCGGGHARSWSLLRLSLIFRRGSTDGGSRSSLNAQILRGVQDDSQGSSRSIRWHLPICPPWARLPAADLPAVIIES